MKCREEYYGTRFEERTIMHFFFYIFILGFFILHTVIQLKRLYPNGLNGTKPPATRYLGPDFLCKSCGFVHHARTMRSLWRTHPAPRGFFLCDDWMAPDENRKKNPSNEEVFLEFRLDDVCVVSCDRYEWQCKSILMPHSTPLHSHFISVAFCIWGQKKKKRKTSAIPD